ncbi:MAG: 2-dehydropantoate 2-reductase [Burkholderiaceae bacterium]|nr:2-dehydropantoate 2-reductase [Burkholderiaceae bacterium]
MKIAVLGAGSIGAYLGGALTAAGGNVVMVGRARMAQRIAEHGLHLTDLQGRDHALQPAQIDYVQDPAALRDADLILVTVKSADTEVAARAIAEHTAGSGDKALVVSFQNGIGNADTLRAALPGHEVLGGMVPFNVVQMEGARLHRGTEGELMLEVSPSVERWKPLFAAAGLPLIEHEDFRAVQWGKLLLNLNNPVNALSGVPLKEELSQRAYRRCVAALMEEATNIMRLAHIEPQKIARVSPKLLPTILRLPDFLFARIAGGMLRIDPEARSSMWEDLQAGRRTEVDYINGAVVRLAESLGHDAPVNRRTVELMRKAEQGAAALPGKMLERELGLCR